MQYSIITSAPGLGEAGIRAPSGRGRPNLKGSVRCFFCPFLVGSAKFRFGTPLPVLVGGGGSSGRGGV